MLKKYEAGDKPAEVSLCSGFDIQINHKNNSFRFISLEASPEILNYACAIEILKKLNFILINKSTCKGDFFRNFSIPHEKIIWIVQMKADEIQNKMGNFSLCEKMNSYLNDNNSSIQPLFNHIKNIVAKCFGIWTLKKDALGIILIFLPLSSASAMMRTSQEFYRMLNPILSYRFEDIKCEYFAKCAERNAMRSEAEKIHHAVVVERLS